MTGLSARLAHEVASIERAKQDEAERQRAKEEAAKQQQAAQSATRVGEITNALEVDLNDDNLFDIVSSHRRFINERHSVTAEIGYYNPDTDFTSSTASKVFDKPILFAIERDHSGKRCRIPIKVLNSFSYLRETKEVHAAIRSDEIASRIAELVKLKVRISFIQHGATTYDKFAGYYTIQLTYQL